MNNKGNHLLSGISWSAFERFSVQGLQFAVFVFMARILSPTDYGLVGMLTIFIVLSHLIAEGGLAQAIIRKLDRTQKDLSTAFFFNFATGVILYGILYLCAPWIAHFYEEPQLVALLRVLGLCILPQSTLVIHRALLTSSLDFKTQAKSTLIGVICSGAVGLYMAYTDYGVWSIVGLHLTNQVATSATLWLVTRWRPSFIFSSQSFRDLFGFGSRILISHVISSIYSSLYSIVIGKVFSAYPLGCFTNARQMGEICSENLTRVVERAAYPHFCHYQQQIRLLRMRTAQYLMLCIFFIAPIMIGLASLAEPLTVALIGAQWSYTAKLLRILCVFFMFYPLISINMMILEVTGRAHLYLRMQLLQIAVGVICLSISVNFGLSAVCGGMILTSMITFIIASQTAGKEIGLGLKRQLRIILPSILIATIMGAIIYALQHILIGEWLKVTLGVIIGILIYFGISILFQPRIFTLLSRLLRRNR